MYNTYKEFNNIKKILIKMLNRSQYLFRANSAINIFKEISRNKIGRIIHYF